MSRAQANTVVNNRVENARNVLLEGTEIGANTWNTPKTAGTNIVGGAYLGGNWWSGFSETAADADGDGLADRPYAIAAGQQRRPAPGDGRRPGPAGHGDHRPRDLHAHPGPRAFRVRAGWSRSGARTS